MGSSTCSSCERCASGGQRKEEGDQLARRAPTRPLVSRRRRRRPSRTPDELRHAGQRAPEALRHARRLQERRDDRRALPLGARAHPRVPRHGLQLDAADLLLRVHVGPLLRAAGHRQRAVDRPAARRRRHVVARDARAAAARRADDRGGRDAARRRAAAAAAREGVRRRRAGEAGVARVQPVGRLLRGARARLPRRVHHPLVGVPHHLPRRLRGARPAAGAKGAPRGGGRRPRRQRSAARCSTRRRAARSPRSRRPASRTAAAPIRPSASGGRR